MHVSSQPACLQGTLQYAMPPVSKVRAMHAHGVNKSDHQIGHYIGCKQTVTRMNVDHAPLGKSA